MDNVGRFELRVSAPYPAWVEIRIDEEKVGSIHHKELRDLAYAVDRATK